jgi:hypothetical protein
MAPDSERYKLPLGIRRRLIVSTVVFLLALLLATGLYLFGVFLGTDAANSCRLPSWTSLYLNALWPFFLLLALSAPITLYAAGAARRWVLLAVAAGVLSVSIVYGGWFLLLRIVC